MRLELSCAKLPAFIRALKLAAPEHLKRAFGKALYRIGKADTEKMRTEGLSALNIHSKGFRNSFKFKATDSREAKSINELTLTEYTGAKPFRIFQTGGDIEPRKSRTLTILTGAARSANGKRKYTQKELQDLINSGKAKIIKTKAGPAVVQVDERTTKSGALRKGSKAVILAWLKPHVTEPQKIDFFKNFESNESIHQQILDAAAEEAIEKTEDEGDE